MTARPAAGRSRARSKALDRYHHGDLRQALVEAALEEVVQSGSEGLRLRELARRVGVNHRAVYRHFADREALVVAVAIEGWHRLAVVAERAREESEEPIRDLLRAYVHFALSNGGHYRCMLGPGSATLASGPEVSRAVLDTIRIVEREVEAQTGEKGAVVRDRVFALWGLAHGVSDLVLCGHARATSMSRAELWILRLCEPILADGGLR